MQRGFFITFEGPEGCGKTTQAEHLAGRLQERGFDVVRTREPGGTATGEAIRDILQHDRAGEPIAAQAEALLFAASRAQLVQRRIRPALESGACVVADRFADSTTVYQGVGRCLGVDPMLAINAFAIDGAEPDVTFLLDCDVRVGLERMDGRNRARATTRDRIERENIEFHERVRQGYRELARRCAARIRLLDGERAESEVAREIWLAVEGLLNKGRQVP